MGLPIPGGRQSRQDGRFLPEPEARRKLHASDMASRSGGVTPNQCNRTGLNRPTTVLLRICTRATKTRSSARDAHKAADFIVSLERGKGLESGTPAVVHHETSEHV